MITLNQLCRIRQTRFFFILVLISVKERKIQRRNWYNSVFHNCVTRPDYNARNMLCLTVFFFIEEEFTLFLLPRFTFRIGFPSHTYLCNKQNEEEIKGKSATKCRQVHWETKENPIHKLEVKKGLWEESRNTIKVIYNQKTILETYYKSKPTLPYK